MNGTNSGTATVTRKRVLVVDDEDDFLNLMQFFLTLEGYDVETVTDGIQAIQAVGREKPDLILLDVIMPRMDGISALRHLRGQKATRDIPVIMLSILDEGKEESKDLNVTDYLVKPFSTEALIQKIRTTLAA